MNTFTSNRSTRRLRQTRRSKTHKSYFTAPNELLERYRTREITAIDVTVYAYLCSLRRKYSGVQVSQKRIAYMCGISTRTVSTSVNRLYKCGLIKDIIIEIVKSKIKYKTAIYILKPPSSKETGGFFFCPRSIFYVNHRLTPKMFTLYFFLCKATSHEYGRSWNSYNDICTHLGFDKNSRSEVMRLMQALVSRELVTKKSRRSNGIFVDNIYSFRTFEDSPA